MEPALLARRLGRCGSALVLPIVILTALPFSCLELVAAKSAEAQTTPKSLVFALDGARADALEIASMPTLQAMISGDWQAGYRGAYSPFAQTIKDAPAVSGPNHASIFTGITSTKHGVTGNDIAQMSAVAYPDYFRLLERNDPTLDTVKLAYWSPDALVPSGADYTIIDSDDENIATAASMVAGTYSDANWALGRDVDAMLVFLDDADGAGHGSGWLSDTYIAELGSIDTQIAQVLAAVVGRPTFEDEDWQVLVTSDHGGYNFSHGSASGAHYNIPFLVSSRSVAQGELSGRPSNVDTTPTVLAHFAIDPTATYLQNDDSTPYLLDGAARGGSVRVPFAGALDEDLVSYHRFEFDHVDATGRGNDALVASGKAKYSRGKFGRAAKVSRKHFLSLGDGATRPDYDFGGPASTASDVTVALWYRGRARNRDPSILGNKDWDSGSNSGFVLTANVSDKSEIGLNLADVSAAREDLYRIDMSRRRRPGTGDATEPLVAPVCSSTSASPCSACRRPSAPGSS